MKEGLIAKEGIKLILPSFAAMIILLIVHQRFLSFIVFIFLLFCVFFFRNPKRHHISIDNQLISPADGKIVQIEDGVYNEYLGADAVKIGIFMSPLDVHVNRAPCDGTVSFVEHKAGEFALAYKKDIDKENEKNYILLENRGEKILLVQIAGFLARRIVSYVKESDMVKKGDLVGVICFGSRVDIYYPREYQTVASLRMKVKAGETILAEKKGTT